MKMVAFVNTKGGVGKTTSSVGVAKVLTNRGETVLLADLDVQGSSSAWAMNANQEGRPLGFAVGQIGSETRPAAIGRTIKESANDLSATWIVVDTSPQDMDRADAAIELAADLDGLVVVPSKTSSLDLPRALVTVEDVNGRAKSAVLLTMARTGTTRLAEARDALAAAGASVLQNEILLREKTAAAAEMEPAALKLLVESHEQLADEIEALLNGKPYTKPKN